MARSDWAALLAAAVQIAYRHDTRPFLPFAKGLARQTSPYIRVSTRPYAHGTEVRRLVSILHTSELSVIAFQPDTFWVGGVIAVEQLILSRYCMLYERATALCTHYMAHDKCTIHQVCTEGSEESKRAHGYLPRKPQCTNITVL